jgi:hypothetical protein
LPYSNAVVNRRLPLPYSPLNAASACQGLAMNPQEISAGNAGVEPSLNDDSFYPTFRPAAQTVMPITLPKEQCWRTKKG